ncbi:helix-turn-helix domain-containing protein [Streptomyces sp. NPDC127098]|uniref:helix-turn-helix domain-containing protein n=1 Tax=Streptomyces sp. NPDC127098 TaxID=3347137 RepID=UPI0036631AA3
MRDLRGTIAALMFATGETQSDLGRGIGLGQTQISRRQAGATPWTLADLDRLAAHYEMQVADLLAGSDHAVRRLPAHRRVDALGGTQSVISAQEESQ